MLNYDTSDEIITITVHDDDITYCELTNGKLHALKNYSFC